MARDKRPTESPTTPPTRKKVVARRSFSGPGSSSSSSSSTTLRPEFKSKGFFFEHNINPDILGDHEGVPFAKKYISEMGMEAIYTPPDAFYPDLVRLFHQNISFPEMEDVRPFAVASIIGKTNVVITPEEMANLLGFPVEPPEDVDEASLKVPHHTFVGPLAQGRSGPGGCTLRVDEPPKLWILDHFLKRNLFQVGHSQQRIGYFQQVLFAALQEEWFPYCQMMAHVMKQGAKNITMGGKKGEEANLPFPCSISFLLQCKYEALTVSHTLEPLSVSFTMLMWRNSLVKLKDKARARRLEAEARGNRGVDERQAQEAAQAAATAAAPVPPPAAAPVPPPLMGETTFQRRARYEHMDSLA